jgi:hypothetical protein
MRSKESVWLNPILSGVFILLLVGTCALPNALQAATPQATAGCTVFPADNIWNVPINTLPVDPRSAAYVSAIGADRVLTADFGSGFFAGREIGIPYVEVPGTQPKVKVVFESPAESDPGPYPIPPDAPIEDYPLYNGDRHVIVLDRDSCLLYELFYASRQADGSWHAVSGAIFSLRSNALRQAGWTSADAAGLPIFAGLVRYDEVASGEIKHALRFAAPQTRNAYVWPARHYATELTSLNLPPLGQRFRLKASYDISGFSPQVQVVLRALKKYGMFLADQGQPWYITGVSDRKSVV